MSDQVATVTRKARESSELPVSGESRALVPVGQNLPSEASLRQEIEELLATVRKGSFRSLEAYSQIGDKLVLAKETLPHGRFEPWAAQFSFGRTWRARLMKLAGSWHRLKPALMEREQAWGDLGRELSLDGAVEFLAHLDICEEKGVDPNHDKFRPATKGEKKQAAAAKREAKRAAEESAKADGAGEGEDGEGPAPVEVMPKRKAAELIVEIAALTKRNADLEAELAKALARAEKAERQALRLRERAQKAEVSNILAFDEPKKDEPAKSKGAARQGSAKTKPGAKRGPGRAKKAAAAT